MPRLSSPTALEKSRHLWPVWDRCALSAITLRLWLDHLGLELPPASTLSDNLNAVSNQTRAPTHQVQLRWIFQQGLDDFQKCVIDSTAVEANTNRPTDSTILVRLITRVCTTGGNLHRLDLPDMNRAREQNHAWRSRKKNGSEKLNLAIPNSTP